MSKPAETGNTEGVSVSLDVVFSVTIPIIIRHGQGDVSITPATPVVKKWDSPNTYSLETRLTRKGLYSSHFNIQAFHTTSGSKAVKIGELKGLSFYTPNHFQIVNIPLKSLETLPKGVIQLKIQDLEKKETPEMGSWSFNLK
ncbi:MAG: hypothetical protein HUK40_12985 [Desulfobacter sp.]|nr:hypothetical protein [Desulfobacter sp.]WDP83813.1 MAG: hypothetical protein HUN05_00375 [Desulfobacter sp.]